jgi:hypothetical protein
MPDENKPESNEPAKASPAAAGSAPPPAPAPASLASRGTRRPLRRGVTRHGRIGRRLVCGLGPGPPVTAAEQRCQQRLCDPAVDGGGGRADFDAGTGQRRDHLLGVQPGSPGQFVHPHPGGQIGQRAGQVDRSSGFDG